MGALTPSGGGTGDTYPRDSMYGIFTYIGVVWGVNVGIYGIHGVSGYRTTYPDQLNTLTPSPRQPESTQINPGRWHASTQQLETGPMELAPESVGARVKRSRVQVEEVPTGPVKVKVMSRIRAVHRSMPTVRGMRFLGRVHVKMDNLRVRSCLV